MDLLSKGFRAPLWKQLFLRWHRSPGPDFWRHAFERLSRHPTPPGFPRYGFLLEAGGSIVAVVLVIASVVDVNGHPRIRCNTSSWYAEPDFRCYAPMLMAGLFRNERATFVNVTPSGRTFDILLTQGFERYCTGRFVAIAAHPRRFDSCPAEVILAECCVPIGLSAAEVELLSAHANYGCISLICRAEGRDHPFVFLPLRRAGLLRFAYLTYCRDPQDFVRFSGPLGRFLLKQGIAAVVLDANRRVEGLFGIYFSNDPKYFRGPDRPRLGDISYSERAMFGF